VEITGDRALGCSPLQQRPLVNLYLAVQWGCLPRSPKLTGELRTEELQLPVGIDIVALARTTSDGSTGTPEAVWPMD
jgi:hypothetical protein